MTTDLCGINICITLLYKQVNVIKKNIGLDDITSSGLYGSEFILMFPSDAKW